MSSEWDGIWNLLMRLRRVHNSRVRRYLKEGHLEPWPVSDQICHTHSEVSEIFTAWQDRNDMTKYRTVTQFQGHFLDEICDVIYSAFGIAERYGLNDAEILDGMQKCLAKIETREGIR